MIHQIQQLFMLEKKESPNNIEFHCDFIKNSDELIKNFNNWKIEKKDNKLIVRIPRV